MTVGRRPKGAVATSTLGSSKWNDTQLMAHIIARSGEYDVTEEIFLSDPYIDGYKLRERNQPFSAINVRKNALPKEVYQERVKLTEKGWRDADADMKEAV